MIPKHIQTIESIGAASMPTKTYLGLDGLEAMKYAVMKALSTERYEHLIYSWDYGIETKDLYGKPHEYVAMELEIRVKDALLADDRVLSVEDFEYDKGAARFTVYTTVGVVEVEKRFD